MLGLSTDHILIRVTVNPVLSPPGDLFISSPFKGGLNRDEGAYLRRGGAHLSNTVYHLLVKNN